MNLYTIKISYRNMTARSKISSTGMVSAQWNTRRRLGPGLYTTQFMTKFFRLNVRTFSERNFQVTTHVDQYV